MLRRALQPEENIPWLAHVSFVRDFSILDQLYLHNEEPRPQLSPLRTHCTLLWSDGPRIMYLELVLSLFCLWTMRHGKVGLEFTRDVSRANTQRRRMAFSRLQAQTWVLPGRSQVAVLVSGGDHVASGARFCSSLYVTPSLPTTMLIVGVGMGVGV